MKKIVFKLREFPHLSETFILAQIITAINCGYDVSLLVVELLDFEASKQKSLIEKYQIDKKIIIEDYKIPKNKFLRLVKWLTLLMFNFKDINYIIQFYRENTKFSLTWLYQWVFYKQFNKVAIFHVQYGTSSTTLAKLKKTGYKPSLVVTFHGHDAFFPINGFIPNNGYYDNLFKYGDLITVNTPYLANIITELGCPKEMIMTVPVGVDTDFFYPKKTQISVKKCKLISVGRLSIVKGHIYAFESVRKLEQEGYNIELTVVGEGPERVKLENYIRKNNLFDSIVLVGAKSQEEVRELLWESDIFLFPSVSLHNGKSTETQGLATIEAMACGLPAVVFDSGGVKYTLENGVSGFICDEFDTDCMCSKVKILIENRDKLIAMGNQAIDFIKQNYSQKMIDKKWEYVYNKVLKNG